MTNFEDELRNSISLRAAGSSTFQLQAFADELADRLEVAEVVFDVTIEPLRCYGRNRKVLEILGYAEDTADDPLVVIVGQHFDQDGSVLTLTDAKKLFGSGIAFLEHAADGWLNANLEVSSREAEHGKYFSARLPKVDRLKFLLITDATMSDRIKSIPNAEVAGVTASFSIWDARRFEDLAESASGIEDTHIDLTRWLPDGLPCLVGAESGQRARSYLAVLPGRLLADVFKEHGSQLLESNVRTFLSARGKVNKGIQYSLAHEPEMFLAYNNGLTTTATGVDVVQTPTGTVIRALDNWQIVNGGQTTSSLVHFLRQGNSRSLDGVFVQMKLVTVQPDQAFDLVSKVSRYANSQNKVSEADFFSNSLFHVRLEQISKRVKAPARAGEQYETRWFYERARGQYENTRNSYSGTDLKRFDLEFPKHQKITKTDWAKFAFSWGQKPHEVSKGAQSNFMAYAIAADKIWEENPDAISDSYFRANVSKAIIYGQLRAEIMKTDWYGTGYLANIVAYAMSKFAFELSRQFDGAKFNLEAVWARQGMSDTTLAAILDVAELVQTVITDERRPQSNVTQWAKQSACWELVQRTAHSLPRSLEADIVSASEHRDRELQAKRQRQMDSGFEVIERMMKVEAVIWQTVVREGAIAGVLSPTERGIIEKLGGKGSVPSERQAMRMLQALENAADHAIISRGDF